MKKIKNKKAAFSLVEILISLLIISVIVVLAAPVVTKRALNKEQISKGGNVAFLYNRASDNSNFPCYVTKLDSTGAKTLVKEAAGKCELHTFTVPDGVHSIDLTLVAGGGGGGGASGATVFKKDFISSETTSLNNLSQERIKDIKINFLTSAGQKGKEGSIDNGNRKIFSGEGGASGNAFVNLNIPEENIRFNYSPDFLNEHTSTTNLLSLEYINDVSGLKTIFNSLKTGNGFGLLFKHNAVFGDYGATGAYFVADGGTTLESNVLFECFKGIKNQASYGTVATTGYMSGIGSAAYNVCGITAGNFKKSQSGEAPVYQMSDYFASGYIFEGGAGGKFAGINDVMGAGGKGASFLHSCNSVYNSVGGPGKACTYDQATLQKIDAEAGKPSYGHITVSYEHPAGSGAGGVGGGAVKINNFKVISGATYYVSVGAGGAGGEKGKDGEITEKGWNKHTTEGTSGSSGSATSIYDENGKLLLMVIGGAGGYGGTFFEDNLTTTDANVPERIRDTANLPLVLYDESVELNFDPKVVAATFEANNDTYELNNNLASLKAIVVGHSFLKDTNTPMFELNSSRDNHTIHLGRGLAIPSGDRDISLNNAYLRGYSSYRNDGDDANFQEASVKYNGVNRPKLYFGLNQRYTIGNALAYAGGLGGFSGLGTKAGCGGLFVGNMDGRLDGNTFDSRLKNTFTLNILDVKRIFNINNFYDGCSINTPDGHQAEFVAPSSVAGYGTSLGAAGAGGGGGGYSRVLGSGSGGDGQNGYVFISWRK